MFQFLLRSALVTGGLGLLLLLAACGPDNTPTPVPANPGGAATTVPAPNNGGPGRPAPTVTTLHIGPTSVPVTPLPQSWQGPLLPDAHIRSVSQPPGAGKVVYAAGDGVYRSPDGGQTWQTLTTSFTAKEVDPAPSNPQILYAASGEGCASGAPGTLQRSSDGGKTWSTLPGGPFQLDIDPANPDKLLGLRCDGLYQSADGATTWTKVPGATSGVQNHDPRFLVRGVNDRAYIYLLLVAEGGGTTLQRSSDSGATWTTASNPVLQSPVSLAVFPKDAKHLYFVGPSGFYSSADAGATWNAHNQGLPIKGGSYLLTTLALDAVNPPPGVAGTPLYLGGYQVGDTKPFSGSLFRWNGSSAWIALAPLWAGAGTLQLLAVNELNNPALLAVDPAGIYRLALR